MKCDEYINCKLDECRSEQDKWYLKKNNNNETPQSGLQDGSGADYFPEKEER